ncbi:YdcF family protein [Lysobacter enzymogenes]|uniref:YdcF family protein n=1 Tax=Lysobacter enzymogenes TaxID=69 RepID=A0A3N2RLX8_LYSEN|nr:YdcF family protein [Lysobacter enzymogenes]
MAPAPRPPRPPDLRSRAPALTTRTAHRLSLFGDRDILQVAAVTATACALSAGLVYLGYFVHVLRVARNAPCRPERGECVLLFGKHGPGGRLDRDFEARLDRAVSLWRERPPRSVVLLGGGAADETSEAELARLGLLARGLANDAPLRLENQSRDTLQNLRNARELLGEGMRSRVTLLSSRYHLARCAWFARRLGYDFELCAAEPRLRLDARMLVRLAGEAAYVCLSDVGARWARLIGNRRMLARVS